MDKPEKQYIEVIERDEKGNIVGSFAFWGKMTIDAGNGCFISINAPGYHEQPAPQSEPHRPRG